VKPELKPDATLARALAAAAMGQQPFKAERFTTGSKHYVYEVSFADHAPVVVRIGSEEGRPAMSGASRLSRLLRPMGVPLPEVLAEHVSAPFPYMILERLAGTDLSHVIRDLPVARLGPIAEQVARAQAVVAAAVPGSGRFGYAVDAASATREKWSDVLRANLARSRSRIGAAGLFSLGPVETVARLVEGARAELDAMPATAFLHDTTTKNVIVTGDGAFSGIVDVDDLCFGDPRYAAALTLAALLNWGGPTAYVDAWLQHAGARDDRLFRVYVLVFLVDFMSEHGQVFNGNQRPSEPHERRRLLDLFGQRLAGLGATSHFR
jgi:aminoglycoside phosphotransferase